MISKKITAYFLAFIISFSLVVLLVSQISVSDILQTLFAIPIDVIILSFLIYLCTYLLRSFRFCQVLEKKNTQIRMLSIVCIHNFLNYILPARTGELSFIILVKKRMNIQYCDGFTTLLFIRFLDATLAIILFLLSLLFLSKSASSFSVFVNIGVFGIIVIALIIFGMAMGVEKQIWIICKDIIFRYTHGQSKYGTIICDFGDKIIHSIQRFKEIPRRNGVLITLSSIAVWIFTASFYYTLARGMGIELNMADIIFASSFISFLTLLPIQGFAGFGTIESGWAIGFMLVGLSQEKAISTGFTFHILLLLYITILFGLGVILEFFANNAFKSEFLP